MYIAESLREPRMQNYKSRIQANTSNINNTDVYSQGWRKFPRFGKLGFGESRDSQVLQRRTVQIRQKSMRTSFKRRCGSVGGAELSICDMIGQRVLTVQVINSLLASILSNVLFQHNVKHLNMARIPLITESAAFSEGSYDKSGKWKWTGIHA